MLRLGDLAYKQGSTSEAVTFWTAAQPLFEQSLQVKDLALVNSRLMCCEKGHEKALV
jgi:hypothetical protein